MTKITLNLAKVLEHADCYSADSHRIRRIVHQLNLACESIFRPVIGDETEVNVKDGHTIKMIRGNSNDTLGMIIARDQTPVGKLIHQQEEIDLPVGIIMIGRNPGACAICLENDQEVSRMHASLTVHGDGRLTLRDLESSNGTFVNDRRIIEVHLVVGDKIKIGQEEFTVN